MSRRMNSSGMSRLTATVSCRQQNPKAPAAMTASMSQSVAVNFGVFRKILSMTAMVNDRDAHAPYTAECMKRAC